VYKSRKEKPKKEDGGQIYSNTSHINPYHLPLAYSTSSVLFLLARLHYI
jgi:hypothetical protein